MIIGDSSVKKIIKIMALLIILDVVNIKATSGPIKQDSIISCNGKYYGNHGNPIHWHEVMKSDDKWISISSETTVPACYIKPVNEKERVEFYKCSDGDTARFIIKGEEVKVRFLAIDTPEIDKNEPYSKEAKEYTCNALKKAKEIYLEYDGNSDKMDKYGRLLAFVYVDGTLLQKKLISNGYAKVAYIYGNYEHVDELKKAEENAKKNKIGIWEEALGDVETIEEISNDEDEVLKIINYIINIIKLIIDLIFK